MLRKVSGPECPKCGCADSLSAGGGRRECDYCGRVFTPPDERKGLIIAVVRYIRARRGGAECPCCGLHCVPYRTMPADSPTERFRYYQCECGERFKSIGEA